MTFRVGMKVTPIHNDEFRLLLPGERAPVFGEVYTIREMEIVGGKLALCFEEIRNPHLYHRGIPECLFRASRFRPVINSVRESSADGAPSLQRTLSEPLAASAPAGDGGEVKLLEWEEQLTKRSDEDPSTEVTGYEAETAFGTFYTVEVGAALFHVVYDYKGLGAFETEIAAKAAAQADYEQRIRSALYARPAPAVEVREALEIFTAHYQQWMDNHPDDAECIVHSKHTFGDLRRARRLLASTSLVVSADQIEALVKKMIPAAVIFADCPAHVQDLRERAAKELRAALSASPREMGQESDGNESQAKATEGKAGMAGVDGPVRRSTAGTGLQVGEASADLPATSEIMDVTAGRDRQPIHESDGGSMEQPFALADAARESPAPRASSGKQEGRTGSEVGAEQIAGSSMSYGPDKPIIAGQAPGPSEPSPSSRSETAGERALSQAEVRAGINILLETIAAKFDGWATWDVWRSEAASLVRSFKHAPPPSPDCSGCKPAGVQKEDATRIEGSMQSDGAATKSAGGEA